MIQIDNAIIMAAGMSSRFAPISYEIPKALLTVHGEVLIERQIEQLHAAGIKDISVVVGYKKEMFFYLAEKYQVMLIENPEYLTRNNHSSLYYARHKLKNTYICSADNYFTENVFHPSEPKPYYSAVYVAGPTNEWCLTTNSAGLITEVHVGGENAWVMLGHVLFDEKFSQKFIEILKASYQAPATFGLLWEAIYQQHIADLHLYLKKYPADVIFEFDSLEDLRAFDPYYLKPAASKILLAVSQKLAGSSQDITACQPLFKQAEVIGFAFSFQNQRYHYYYQSQKLERKD